MRSYQIKYNTGIQNKLYFTNADNQNTLEEFLENNPKTGYVVFQIFHDSPIYGRLPVPNAKVNIFALLGNGAMVNQIVVTDGSGKTQAIPLATVNGDNSLNPKSTTPFFTYNATVEASDFFPADITDIPVFENITSIQPVRLIPKVIVKN